jgi:hypothetical protein
MSINNWIQTTYRTHRPDIAIYGLLLVGATVAVFSLTVLYTIVIAEDSVRSQDLPKGMICTQPPFTSLYQCAHPTDVMFAHLYN